MNPEPVNRSIRGDMKSTIKGGHKIKRRAPLPLGRLAGRTRPEHPGKVCVYGSRL